MTGMSVPVVTPQSLTGYGDRVGCVFEKNDAGKAHGGIYVLPTPGYFSPMDLITRTVHRQTSLTETIRELDVCNLRHGPWVAGGAARAVFEGTIGRAGGDIDIFLGESGQEKRTLAHIGKKTTVTSRTKNKQSTTTLLTKISLYGKDTPAKIQVIPEWPGGNTVESLLQSFDFTVCQFVTDGRILIYTDAAAYDVERRVLRFQPQWTGRTRPVRLIKYLNQGFTPDGPMLETAYRLDERQISETVVFDNGY
ncbi:MAG: hypothetical protein EOO77_30415 [Oxalobacteraceae bacterium]|nr:MAG: hypothetical protein EOO77_30415 [Oxalobacteraceae bacterium]